MTQLTFSELDWRGLSPKLWGGFAPPVGGKFQSTASGNPAFGFFDDFMDYHGTSLYDGYFTLGTGTGTVLRTASNLDTSTAAQKLATGLGIVNMLATADNDEGIIAWGNGLDAPFKLDNAYGFGDLCFECRVLFDILLASDFCFYIGLAELGAQATTKLFGGAQAVDATYDKLGFNHLLADSTGINTVYEVGGQTAGGTDDIHTTVASQYVKLGFKWDSVLNRVKFFVNGVEQTSYEVNGRTVTAGTFPDDNFMTPMAMIGTDQATDMTAKLDWWACAQYIHPVV